MATVTQTKLLTAEEFMAADLGEGTFELVRGEVVEVPPAMPEHGRGLCECRWIALGLRTQVRLRLRTVQRLGRGDRARPRHGSRPRRLLLQPRSLASIAGRKQLASRAARPGRRGRFARQPARARSSRKSRNTSRRASLLVWVVYPEATSVSSIYRPDDETSVVLREDDIIENLPELPGFRCPVSDFFV